MQDAEQELHFPDSNVAFHIDSIETILVYDDLRNLKVMRSVKRIRVGVVKLLAAKHGQAAVEHELEVRGILVSPEPQSSAATPVKTKDKARSP